MKAVGVLLVEDNAGDSLLIGQILADMPVTVRLYIARDGEQALQMLEDLDFKPDLIILDLNIPRVSGSMLLERNQRKDIPVIVFSSTWKEGEMEQILKLGARELVQKPTDIQAFSDAITGIVRKWAVAVRKANGAS